MNEDWLATCIGILLILAAAVGIITRANIPW
jgi:hypothetical protein